MDEIDQLHPERFEQPKEMAPREQDATIDRWLHDHFHGNHHMRVLADPFRYLQDAVEDLKRRLTR